MQTQTRFILSIGALALLASPAAYAEGRNPLAGQPAIRHRVEMRKLRFEISPQLMLSINQPYLIGVGGGANLVFHITDWLGVGLSGHYTANVAAPLEGRVEEALPNFYAATTDAAAGLRQPSKSMFRDHLVGPTGLIAGYLTLTPIGGKFSLFNALFANYDMYFMGGLGGVFVDTPLYCQDTVAGEIPCAGGQRVAYRDTTAGGAGMRMVNAAPTDKNAANDVNLQNSDVFRGGRFAGMIGIGVHIFFNHFIGLQLELRDYIYSSNPGGLDVVTTDNQSDVKNSPVLSSNDEYIVNNLYFGLGLSIMLPPTAKISR